MTIEDRCRRLLSVTLEYWNYGEALRSLPTSSGFRAHLKNADLPRSIAAPLTPPEDIEQQFLDVLNGTVTSISAAAQGMTYCLSTQTRCSPDCRLHYEHVYVISYGEPTRIAHRDHALGDRDFDYPVRHYVGFRRQTPPRRRIAQHSAGSVAKTVAVVPRTSEHEAELKRSERCPACGESLWYYQVPNPISEEGAVQARKGG